MTFPEAHKPVKVIRRCQPVDYQLPPVRDLALEQAYADRLTELLLRETDQKFAEQRADLAELRRALREKGYSYTAINALHNATWWDAKYVYDKRHGDGPRPRD